MYRVVVFTYGGILLWSHDSSKTQSVPNSVVNSVISKGFIEGSKITTIDGHAIKYTTHAELGITVAVIYPVIVNIPRAEEISSDLSKVFISVNAGALGQSKSPDVSKLDISRFDALAQIHLAELQPENIHVPSQPTSVNLQKDPEPAQEKKKTKRSAKKSKKERRKWDGESDSEDGTALDFSESKGTSVAAPAAVSVDLENYGTQSKDGFVVKELSDELHSILGSGSENLAEQGGSFSFFKGIVGGKKLTDQDLDKALAAMQDHLVRKNVAKEVADLIADQVRKDLVGTTTESWTSVKSTVRQSVQKTLRKILTPNTSVDLLLEIKRSQKNPRPYVISVVGVNGVGKSTNLGKIAFWLLQNKMKVLIAACDTFRSGAVEQLKVHVERLKQLTQRQNAGEVDIYDQGYGKDAAVIARQAVEHGQKHGFDVVLIDTAGRRHNDDRLMSSLEKFGKLANPDKIIMVGEALVGTDSVAQARNFDAAFGPNRRLDFFLVSKCDTVGDMLGTLVNMTYNTGVPVLFVGVGQNYTDLRTLSVSWAVDLLLA